MGVHLSQAYICHGHAVTAAVTPTKAGLKKAQYSTAYAVLRRNHATVTELTSFPWHLRTDHDTSYFFDLRF